LIGLLVRSLSPTFSSIVVNAARSTLGAVAILMWVVMTGSLGGLIGISGRSFALLAVSVLLAVWLGDTAFFESTRALGLGRAMTVSMIYPLIAALLASVFLGEALTVRVALGSLVALTGLVLTVAAKADQRAERAHFWRGVAAATVAAFAWAGSVILLKPSLKEVDPINAQAIRLPVAAAMLWATPWTWRAAAPLRAHGWATLWSLLALGVLTALSSIMFVTGIRYAGVAVATVLSSTAPVFAIPLGLFFLGERLAASAIVGGAITVVGIVLLQL
jgi:drug/metabolite transporter (DMT)-like permease